MDRSLHPSRLPLCCCVVDDAYGCVNKACQLFACPYRLFCFVLFCCSAAMRDPRLDELIQMETWDWWKAQVFYLREKKDYADAEALFMEFKIPASGSND